MRRNAFFITRDVGFISNSKILTDFDYKVGQRPRRARMERFQSACRLFKGPLLAAQTTLMSERFRHRHSVPSAIALAFDDCPDYTTNPPYKADTRWPANFRSTRARRVLHGVREREESIVRI